MPAMRSPFGLNRTNRKASNAENLVPRAKHVPYKAARLANPNPLRESSIRRRNRVLSGFSTSYSIINHVKQQRLKPKVSIILPTPPATPGSASVEITDVEMTDAISVDLPQQSSNILKLPRTLKRPPYTPIEQAVVEGVDPEALAGVPHGYVRRATEYLAADMLKVVASVKMPQPQFSIPPGLGLPKELAVIVHDLSAEMPTHLLAVQALNKPNKSAPLRTKVELYPVHNIVLATQCTRLTLPHSRPVAPPAPGGQLSLPVVPIALHHPESFPLVHNYLYNKTPEVFLASLLPRAPTQELLEAAKKQNILDFAAMLVDTFTPQVILRYLQKTFGVYTTVCSLGLQDDRMWYMLNIAWEILVVTASMCAKNSRSQS